MSNKAIKITISVLLAAAIAALSFMAGYLVKKCSTDKTIASYEWALKTIKENYYLCDPDESFTETSIKAMVAAHLDEYSEYYTKEEYAAVQKSNAGSKSGVGVSYAYQSGRGIYISRVVGNSPAYKSGLRPGEWLISGSKEGVEVTFDSSTAFSEFISSVSDGVQMTFTSEDGKSYSMAKSEYSASYTYLNTSTERWAVNPDSLSYEYSIDYTYSCLPEGCAYLRLDQFYGTAATEFYKLVEKFNALNCTSLILDLRSNGGGYVSVMQDIAGCFADGSSKLAMLSRDKKGKEEAFNCKKITKQERRVDKSVKVFVLANAGTASASEALIGAMVCYGALEYENIFLSEYDEAYIQWYYGGKEGKNARTFGKGIMQTPFTNSATGEVLKLTTAKIFWPDKKTSIHDTGITAVSDGVTPACTAVPTSWEWTKGDSELRSAVETIKNRL